MRPEAIEHAAGATPVQPEADARRTPRVASRVWLVALLPLFLLAGLIALIVRWDPTRALQEEGHPPVEVLTFQRVELGPDGIVATVMNDGPDPVTIAQVIVDDAYWAFAADRGTTLRHLGRTSLTIPYPWVQGEAHAIRIVSATGATFDHEIPVAVKTPKPDARYLAIFGLIGLYVGVIPVALGLIWYPLVSRLGKTGLDFLLALTLGLLLFLLADAAHDGFEVAESIPGSFQGAALFFFGAVTSYLALEALGAWIAARRAAAAGRGTGASTRLGAGFTLALLVAIGIGLHNFGEGLAIGAAFSLGEAALGTLLIIGFTLHNTTDGLAIVAPLARERARLGDLVTLGVIGGAPTIVGAWLGGLLYSPVLSVLFLAIGAGAIAQVILQISRQMAGSETMSRFFARGPVLAGLVAGFAIMYSTGMLVG